MKKYTKIVLASTFILLLGFVFWQFKIGYFKNKNQSNILTQQASTSLRIDGGISLLFDVSDFVGKTALDATQAKAKVMTDGTGINAFVVAINDRVADTKKHEFWELDANGTETQVGAGSYIIRKGDSILWHINTY